ncbi:hypothetical protein D9613_012471 [Agrocybe pediades]|uniref:Uncharacterized protein n=1 Tax=Agrocybe pediades TaxID=84607 RepID=A0A8H4QS08_9AGAR|nr:hypothetical protein D9613_012471 [Agrocybe pediades]
MLLQCIRERLINYFTIARPAFQLLDERLNVEPISGLEVSAVPIAVLPKRHGRLQTAIICALVESVAFLCLLFQHGIEPSILSTLPLLGSRFQTIVIVAFVYIVNHLVSLSMRIIAYLGHTFLGTKLKRPIVRIICLLHTILSNTIGGDYLLLADEYFKAFLDYAFRQAEKRIYEPFKEKVDNMKKSSSFGAFVYRRVLEFIAFPVFSLSIVCAFLFVYATFDINSALPVGYDDSEELSTTVGSSMPSADTTSTAVDTSPSENVRSALEITESEDTAAAVGLLEDMKSVLDTQQSFEVVEKEGSLEEEVVAEGSVVRDVAEELKVPDDEAPIQKMAEEELVEERSEAEEPVDGIAPDVDDCEGVEAGVDAEYEAEVTSPVEVGDTSDVVDVVEEEVVCDEAESVVDVEEVEQDEEEVVELEEEALSVDVEEDVEEVSGEVEEEVDGSEEDGSEEEVDGSEEEVDGSEEAEEEVDASEEVDYAEESGEIEEAEFSEEVSGEAEEEEVYEQLEEEESGEVEEADQTFGGAEVEVEYAQEDEHEVPEEVEEVFEFDEEPRKVELDIYIPSEGAENLLNEYHQEEEDPNTVDGLGLNSIRVNLSNESLVSSTVDHANMGLVTTMQTESVLINIVASSTVASLEREACEVEEEVEAEKEEDNGVQEQSEASAIVEAEEPDREVEGSMVAVEKVESAKGGKEETSVRNENRVLQLEGLAHKAVHVGESPDQKGTHLESEAEKERLLKQRVREIAREMAKGGALSPEEKAILLSSYSRKKDSATETKSAQCEVKGVTSDVNGAEGVVEAVSMNYASSSPTTMNASTEETPEKVEAEIGVACVQGQPMEVKHVLQVVEAEAEVVDDEPERPELMQMKSPRVEFRSRALSLHAIVGMEPQSFSSLALGGGSNAFEIPTRLTDCARSSLSRRTLSLGEWAAAPIIPVLVEAPRRTVKTVQKRKRYMSLP